MAEAVPPARAKSKKMERLRVLLPELWALILPRRKVLIAGMVLIALSRLASMAPPLALKYLLDDVIGKGRRDYLPWVVLAMSGATIFHQLTNYALVQMFSRSTTRMIAELRCKLAAHVLRLSLRYHDIHKSGSLSSRVINDVQGLQNLVGTGLLNFIGNIATSLVALGLMASFSLVLTLVAVVSLLGVGVLIGRGAGRIRSIALERTRIFADVFGHLTEMLVGVRVVKAYRAEEREEATFAAGIKLFVDNFLKSVNLNSGLSLAVGLIWGAVGAAVLWVGSTLILAHRLKVGEFFAFNVLLGYAVAPVTQIVSIGNTLMEAFAGLERTRDLLNEPREDRDPLRTVKVGPLRGEVTFKDVQFSYVDGTPVLSDFSFCAVPGTVTALVGPSGSGKSTTIGLIASFYRATGGTVLVDGHDLATVELSSYRSQLGVVLQETLLFAGSILENVAYANPRATRQEILAACRTARVDEFAEKLANKYDTKVGERGVMLSGGQRQRIAIARALLANPRILILDEATSSLDSHSEALIQEALSQLLIGRTTFVIAHRLSTIRKADQILVVKDGRIVECGTHVELLGKCGFYAEMHGLQHHVDANLFLAPGENGLSKDTTGSAIRLTAAAEEPVGIEPL